MFSIFPFFAPYTKPKGKAYKNITMHHVCKQNIKAMLYWSQSGEIGWEAIIKFQLTDFLNWHKV